MVFTFLLKLILSLLHVMISPANHSGHPTPKKGGLTLSGHPSCNFLFTTVLEIE
jgi:hypothetical protein